MSTKTMKALVLKEPGSFAYEERPVTDCGEGEVRVRIEAAAVCGSDVNAILGRNALFTYPRVLGHEAAGVVDAVGEGVTSLSEGDRVCLMPCISCGKCRACRKGKTNCCTQLRLYGVKEDGGMQEYMTTPERYWLKIPFETEAKYAALAEPLTIGAHAVSKLSLTEGDRALVIGAGPIGASCAFSCAARGALVVMADASDARVRFAKERFGFEAFNVTDADYGEKLLQISGGELFDAVIDTTAAKPSMDHAHEALAQGGEMVFVGIHKDDFTVNDFDFHMKEPALFTTRNSVRADYEQVLSLWERKKLAPEKLLTHEVSFADAGRALTEWVKPEAGVFKGAVVF